MLNSLQCAQDLQNAFGHPGLVHILPEASNFSFSLANKQGMTKSFANIMKKSERRLTQGKQNLSQSNLSEGQAGIKVLFAALCGS